jgi:phage terminase large subunit
MVGCEIADLPDLFDTVPEREKWPTHRRQRQARDDQPHAASRLPEDHGGHQGRAESLEEGVEFLQSFDIIVHPRCAP